MVPIGLQPHLTDRTMSVQDATRLAAERGFASVFVCEHTHIPVNGASVSPRGVMPDWVKHIWDPYIALAYVAATTEMEIGTAVALVAEHDPIALAKTIASLDRLSGGRLVLGVGWGWHREEFEDHNPAPARQRVTVLREKLALMKQLWTEDEAEYEGAHVHLPLSWSWPKPSQAAGPPVLLGVAANQRNFDRIAAWADGWIPMAQPMADDDAFAAFAEQLGQLRRTWEEAGRAPDDLDVTVLMGPASADDVSRASERADEIGIRRVLVQVDEESMADFEAIVDRVRPALAGRP